ncbi:hypothetical protein DT23_17450 [Thioclava indica]|uniref:Uncharacterized protein n=1 Tax=Thioclava indica TaxID=1353528 RepID=A0A074JMN2_9RHOB|nr:hypothetical protein DT23_17450 [Thioclava indica]
MCVRILRNRTHHLMGQGLALIQHLAQTLWVIEGVKL